MKFPCPSFCDRGRWNALSGTWSYNCSTCKGTGVDIIATLKAQGWKVFT